MKRNIANKAANYSNRHLRTINKNVYESFMNKEVSRAMGTLSKSLAAGNSAWRDLQACLESNGCYVHYVIDSMCSREQSGNQRIFVNSY